MPVLKSSLCRANYFTLAHSDVVVAIPVLVVYHLLLL